MNIPQEELNYLEYAKEKIREAMQTHGVGQEELRRDLYEKRKYLWQELVGAERAIQDQYERTAQESDIEAGEKALYEAQLQEYRLKKLIDSPYFARVDFLEKGQRTAEAFYIGKFGLTDMEMFEQVICDWRSDVAALYYNFEPGKASFSCPNGEVHGEMTRKRQFQIAHGEMQGCFDTTVSIEDRFLQHILSAHADEQMKTIVDSIQHSQNEIVRDTEHSVVAISGCAGSGKTSVALHRIAYLLYHARSSLSASECMIFSPNTLFEDYIASVLPDLGEEQVWQTTFADFATEALGSVYEVRSFLDAVSDTCEQHLREKGSIAFAEAIQKCTQAFEQGISFSDCVFEGNVLLTAAQQEENFRNSRRTLSYRASIARLRNQLIETVRAQIKSLRTQIAQRLVEENGASAYLSKKDLLLNARLEGIHTTQRLLHDFDATYMPNCTTLYAELLEKQFGATERSAFEQRCTNGCLFFEDAGPLLYLMTRLGLIARSDRIRQIVIDEAQDYTDLQYMLLLELYPHARFTVLGDPEQALTNGGNFVPVLMQAEDRSAAQYTLDVNYRSSQEIVAFTNRLAQRTLCRSVARSGGAVIEKDTDEQALATEINAFLNEGDQEELAAVVCADAEDCEMVFRALHRADTCLLLHEFAARNRRICVLPVALAKGLEFDRVAVVNRSNKLNSGRLYVACTRALHRLALYHV